METNENRYQYWADELDALRATGNLRSLPAVRHDGKWIIPEGQPRMLNLSSNDYLGLAGDKSLRQEFIETLSADNLLMSSSSSRLLTGNFRIFEEMESLLAHLFGTESALVFNCGYHANTGILPAVADEHTLILADKLVHASLIDGIRLCTAKCIRYRHNNYEQLERLVDSNHSQYHTLIIAVESIYSMDGDITDLRRLVDIKRKYPNVMLYVDEAHAIGVRGEQGLGLAEEQHCIAEIDFLVGTFGKAIASAGAYIACRKVLRDYLVNRMRPFIFTTALPPLCMEWTLFIFRRLPEWKERRKHLLSISTDVQQAIARKTGIAPASPPSQIIPLQAGESLAAVALAQHFRREGFYVLPVRPPTVPAGTSRLRFSLTSAATKEEIQHLVSVIQHI